MLLDSSYLQNTNVTVIRTNLQIRIIESERRFENNPNITQADIDAGERKESKGVQYVNKGNSIKIGEKALNNNR
jgi:hypothetical protein